MAKGKFAQREEARRLRKEEGLSLNEITSKLGVSKGSVSLWVRDVELTDEQKAGLRDKNPAYNNGAGRERWRESCKSVWLARRKDYQEDGRRMAKSRDVDFIAGCMLYWAEGSKSRSTLRMTNTDPNMLKFFVVFLKKYFDIPNEDIGVTVRFYSKSGLSVDEVEKYWAEVLNVPKECFKKAEVDHDKRPTSGQKIKHKFGVCAVQTGNVVVLQKIYGAIQEYIGFIDDRFGTGIWA